MNGLLGFAVIWGLGRRFGWPGRVLLAALAGWWLVLVAATAPGGPLPGLGVALGGEFRLWVLAGPVAALVLAYSHGLRLLRARARPAAVPAPAPQGPFSPAETERYARHLLLRDIGGPGQQRLKAAHVLVVGAGGLGAPVLMYLAAAGVGRITVIDPDVVEVSNLQRQIIHAEDRRGQAKVHSATTAMRALNPFVTVEAVQARLDEANGPALVASADLVLDGTDNFDTRYLVNRLCVAARVPLIAGAITQWEGQLSLYDPARGGPCYDCVFPVRPAPGLVPTCAEAGVAAPLPGVLGAMMAMEAVKEITGAGQGLRGRLLIHDALYAETRVVRTHARTGCPVCGGAG
ncbi:molybdopterin-synthase adenylyltransferase MoeB [Neotabrizicola sp. VNH66]|uniref:molybdopterin-synthase adenylyltransferase MoeB n=1 Tax=Neotabrizicola sp. VNH66 TaxID=3400918 RepID=UPI003C0FB165